MFEKWNERLAKVKEQQRKKQKWEKQLARYEKVLQENQLAANQAKQILQNEAADVEKLSGLSLTNLFVTIAGNKEDRLRKEKREVARAHLKHEEALKAKSDIQEAIQNLKEKLNTLPDVDRDYKEILSEKEKLIHDTNSPLTDELYAFSEHLAELQAYLVEMEEAIKAGKEVRVALADALRSLDSAANWGTWDMLGGGMITTAIKHNHMDEAKESIHSAQAKMRTFHNELLDVDQDEGWGIDISGLATFADYFFDGLISDWFVQGKIKDSREQTERQKENVEKMLKRLKEDYATKRQNLYSVEKKRRILIEVSK